MSGPRHEFPLSADDTEYMDNTFPGWEAVSEGYILIPHFPLPGGYTVAETTVAIQIPPGYPATPLDMVYFYPAVLRADGVGIPATEALQPIDGNMFQRWSRHYRPETWMPNEDNLATHILAIGGWLEAALESQVPA